MCCRQDSKRDSCLWLYGRLWKNNTLRKCWIRGMCLWKQRAWGKAVVFWIQGWCQVSCVHLALGSLPPEELCVIEGWEEGKQSEREQMWREWKKEGWRKKKKCIQKRCVRGKQPTEQNFCSHGENNSLVTGMGDQCAAEDSKWSLLIIMWTAGL